MTELKQEVGLKQAEHKESTAKSIAMAIQSEQGLFWQQALLTCLLLILQNIIPV